MDARTAASYARAAVRARRPRRERAAEAELERAQPGSPATEPESATPDERSAAAASPRARWGFVLALALLFAVGIAVRGHNAFGYWVNNGFDAPFNWGYVHQLTTSWELPHPEAHWAAARPPLFFYAGGALARTFGPRPARSVWAIRVASSALGVATIGLIAWFVHREGRDRRRTAIAAALLLFLPAHIYMSAMLNEEITVASLTTLALLLFLRRPRDDIEEREARGAGRLSPRALRNAVAIGLAGGLAFLTKLTGVLVVGAVLVALALDAWRERRWRPAIARGLVIGVVAAIAGGWFYARSLATYGYLYPHSLDTHKVMLDLPPGERRVGDYLTFPLSTFTNPRLDSEDLLYSVWGGTYATLWFDGQRHFVPRAHENVDRIAPVILVLALVPTVAFGVGMLGGVRRAIAAPGTLDAPMLALLAITLAGYAAFTWRNPWYPTVKGTYLLGLALPFAWWASDVLARWTRAPRARSVAVWGALAVLWLACLLAFTWGTPLWTMTFGVDLPGLRTMPVRG